MLRRKCEIKKTNLNNLTMANITMKLKLTVVMMVFLSILFTGCADNETAISVDLSKKEVGMDGNTDPETVKIAIAAVISTEESFVYYNDLLDYISDRLDKPVTLVQRKTYQEINDLVRKKEVDMAFVCSKSYVDGDSDFSMELLAVPVVNGKTTYQSYIIVRKDSNIEYFEDLKGKTFAFTDPISNTGMLYPVYLLAKLNETPDTFFKVNFYTYSHDRSIQAVNEKLVDGAAVDSLVWEYENTNNPDFTKNTKVIFKSQPFGIPPVVVPVDLDPQLKEKLKTILLNAHKDADGKEILDALMIERFIEIEKHNYQSIRDMEHYIGEKQK